ncbi:MAG: VWA domain-containing protein [bacterium]|nr:VWA domain-containing protein [bacterium]
MCPKRCLAALTILLLPLAAAGRLSAKNTVLESSLDDYYADWLTSVSPLLHPDERRAFDTLLHDAHRELFIWRFWEARHPGIPRRGTNGGIPLRDNPALIRWHSNFEEARQRFEHFGDVRAQALMLAGKPARVAISGSCGAVFRPLEIWSYSPWQAAQHSGRSGDQGFTLLFWHEAGSYRHWTRSDGLDRLIFSTTAGRDWTVGKLVDFARAHRCFRRTDEDDLLEEALATALGPDELRERLAGPPPDPAWLTELTAEIERLPDPGAALAARPAEIAYPGRYQRRTIVHARVDVPIESLERNAEGLVFDRLEITGDVRRGERLFDVFRVVHHLAGAAPRGGPTVPLSLYRRLRPGRYTLGLRVEDSRGLALLRETRVLEVPALEQEASPPAGSRLGFPALTRLEVGVLTTFPSVELLAPSEPPLVGEVEIEAVTTGGPIERVDFLLDGRPAGRDEAPPFSAVLSLDSPPHPQTVEAVAHDPAGREIARDRLELNAHAPRFAVRLVEPAPGRAAERVTVEVDVPAGETLERVELYLDDRRLATLREPPFTVPLAEPRPRPGSGSRAPTYLRAVAFLRGGQSIEDVVLIDVGDPGDEIDVDLVEVYTTVLDRHGRFVTALTAQEFRVLEDGESQEILRFGTVENLAVNVALLMDVSSSMRRRVELATASAQRFFETVLRPTDRASLLTFNHDIRRLVPFTHDVGRLRWGAVGTRAWGTTRLHDGLIFTVHSFGGLEGKRALVLLSDGQDVDSDFYFKQVLEYTLRSGVAVYPIVLDVDDEVTVANLEQLALETGGRFFAIGAVSELDRVYRRLEEELRSQYLLVYRPPEGKPRRAFRRVEVEVLRDGLRTRALRGYYP